MSVSTTALDQRLTGSLIRGVSPLHAGADERVSWVKSRHDAGEVAAAVPFDLHPSERDQVSRMLIARAITSAASDRDISDSEIIMSFAQIRIAEMSVGLKASAVLNERTR
jgi:hypothetical protein